MFNTIISIIKTRLDKNGTFNKEDQAYLQYGLQILLILISELFIILSIAYILNIFWPVAVAILSFLLIRPYVGGVHMPSYLLCLFISLITFLVIGLITISIDPGIYSIIIWITLIFFIGLLMINKYAPADTETIPIKDPKQRNILKTKGRYVLLIWAIISLLITLLFQNHLQLIFASSLGILSNIILMHPFLFQLVQKYLPEHQ